MNDKEFQKDFKLIKKGLLKNEEPFISIFNFLKKLNFKKEEVNEKLTYMFFMDILIIKLFMI